MKVTFTDEEIKRIAKNYFYDYANDPRAWLDDDDKPYTRIKLFEIKDFLRDLMDFDDMENVLITSNQKKIIYDTYLKYANESIKKIQTSETLRDEIDEVLSKYGYATSDEIELDEGVIYIEEN